MVAANKQGETIRTIETTRSFANIQVGLSLPQLTVSENYSQTYPKVCFNDDINIPVNVSSKEKKHN